MAKTLVECIAHQSILITGSDKLISDFRIADCSPEEVLDKTILNYRIGNYLGVAPWLITVREDRAYLDISEANEGMRVHGSLNDFLSCDDFALAKRKESLTEEKRKSLVNSILNNLSLENYTGILVSESPHAPLVYAHVLSALGHKITPEEVDKMLSEQSKKRDEDFMRRRYEEARRMVDVCEIMPHSV